MTRPTILLLAALALPAALRAQQPAGAPAASPRPAAARTVTEAFHAFDSHYASWILAALDSIPASKYGFRPTPKQQSVGYIAQHLENANLELCASIGGTPLKQTAKDSLADTVKALWPKDTLVARYRASLDYCKAALDRVDDAKLATTVQADGRSIVHARYMLAFVTDLAEHYAQLASYMRLMGLVPPSALPRPAR